MTMEKVHTTCSFVVLIVLPQLHLKGNAAFTKRLGTKMEEKRNPVSQDDWTKLTSKDIDTQAFIRKMEAMKQGETMECPFCHGTVRMTVSNEGTTVFSCDTCDMSIRLESSVCAP